MYGRESIVFGSKFRNRDFDGFTLLKSFESENDILSVWTACLYTVKSLWKVFMKCDMIIKYGISLPKSLDSLTI